MKIDFTLQDEGSLFLLHPHTTAAREWMEEHLPMGSAETQFWGEAIVIEHRYIGPIVEGIQADGLAVGI